ncbi:MAG: DUF6449 domain-containing protein [Eubacterium sp.]
MTSTALSFSNFKSAFAKVFKARLLSAILIFAGCIGVACIAIGNVLLDVSYKNSDISENAVILLIWIAAFISVFSLSNAYRMFKEIYKKQSCDAYFSVPIRREEYFIANYLYGALVNTVCYFGTALFYIGVLVASDHTFDASYLPKIFAMFAALLAIYSAFVMCAVASGRRLYYILLSLIFIFCPSTFFSGIIIQINSIWGFSSDLSYLSAVNPIENSALVAVNENMLPLIIISVAEIVVMFAAGLILFKNREAEIAETGITGRVIPYAVLALLIGAMYFEFGIGNTVIDIILGIIAAAIFTFAFGKIFFRKAFTKKTTLTLAVVCTGLTALSVIVATPAFNFYVKYVPDAELVESAEVCTLDSVQDFGMVAYLNDIVTDEYTSNDIILENPDNIEKVIELHKATVSNDIISKSKYHGNVSLIKALFLDELLDDGSDDEYDKTSYKLTYHLKNGKTVSRTYSVNLSLISEKLDDVYKNEEAVDCILNELLDKKIFYASLYDYYDYDYDEEETDNDESAYYYNEDLLRNFDIKEFTEAYRKDLLSYDKDYGGSWFESNILQWTDSYYPEYSLTIYYVDEANASDEDIKAIEKMTYHQVREAGFADETKVDSKVKIIYSDMKNTIKYLESLESVRV